MNNYPVSSKRQMQKIRAGNETVSRINLVFSNYVDRLAEFRNELDITRSIFERDEIWPDQRDYVLNTFEATQRVLGGFTETIQTRDRFSRQNRYVALVNACHVSEQIDKSISAIREINLNQRGSRKISKINKVRESLRCLDLSFNDLMQGLDNLFKNS